MKNTILILLGASAGMAAADIPHKMPITRYYKLWNESLITTKPLKGTDGPENPFMDYALGGIAPVPGGYQVTLLNKKKPDDRVTLLPGQGKFRVKEVKYDNTRARGVVVILTNGEKEGSVTFDDKLLTIKTPAPAQPQHQGRLPGHSPVAQPVSQPPTQPPVLPGGGGQPSAAPPSSPPSGPNSNSRAPRQRVFPTNR